MSATLLRPSPGGSARTDRGLSGVGPQTIVKEGSTEVWQDENKAYIGDIPEFDAAGTELGKEARIWKIYVEQSDQWDAELVDGWNK
ncbi:hypothetical protein B0J17DRAFT_679583 [Rhizoctonia solani]|nr:hypothetical protein B0J17DRAFT_679583 [Rhizoctonia solani]